MRLLIFGASGPTGRLLLLQALAEGHQVTAATRNPATIGWSHERLAVVQADVEDRSAVERAVAGHDAVLSVYGVPYSLRPIRVYSEGTDNIISAMRCHGVRRYLGVTSGGTSPVPQPTSSFFFERVLKPTLGRTLYDDMRRMEAIVMTSDLDWTIVRPAGLVDMTATGRYHVAPGYVIPQELSTARADLADFLLRALPSAEYLRQALAISTPGAMSPRRRFLSLVPASFIAGGVVGAAIQRHLISRD